MNVLFISECSGNALKQTRRILDQFAERRGERTWQTSITKDGLETVRKMLRRGARKNSAISCHWIRGLDHTELLWIVGNSSRFNSYGGVPTNTTTRKLTKGRQENNWHSLNDIYLLAALGSLFHDLGKACDSFQARLLKPGGFEKNIYRHEWISLRLLESFVGADTDQGWLTRLADGAYSVNDWLDNLQRDGIGVSSSKPFERLPALAQAVGWLVLTHHRLPVNLNREESLRTEILEKLPGVITADWNGADAKGRSECEISTYWTFGNGLPVDSEPWKSRVMKIARKILEGKLYERAESLFGDPFVMHLARLVLMTADHHYSSLTEPDKREKGSLSHNLFANTNRKTGLLNQKLDEHLIGVERFSGSVVHALPLFHTDLPRLVNHRELRRRSASRAFAWQDRAVEAAASLRRSENGVSGAFVVNMASTGCGKTFANVKIMNALCDPKVGLRCAFALGLRTLTRQTGEEFRRRLGLNDEEVAILVGGSGSRELAEFYSKRARSTGSESMDELLPEDGHLIFDGGLIDHPSLSRICADGKAKQMLSAPILVSTIDHLVPATEGIRGGRQIAPMLRLLSGDLVLDELDDYDIEDLPAVFRLMNWAGLLGCRVAISSATLPPSIVNGMFESYLEGLEHFRSNVGVHRELGQPVSCLFVDEFCCKPILLDTLEEFASTHLEFVKVRRECLSEAVPRRLAQIVDLEIGGSPQEKLEAFASRVIELAVSLHNVHCEADSASGKKVSFGLVRMANIGPLCVVAKSLYKLGLPSNYQLHLCVYHSQHALLARSAIEEMLDRSLNRRDPDVVFKQPEVRSGIDGSNAENHLFIVLSSPIAEVGRDHDYSWSIVEPSSMRSIIQLAGRVRRHRDGPCESANIFVLDRNYRCFEADGKAAYLRPGFENEDFKLKTHDLRQLVSEAEFRTVDSRSRITENPSLNPTASLADLEHARLRKLVFDREMPVLSRRSLVAGGVSAPPLGAHNWWTQPAARLSGMLQKQQVFRKQTRPEVDCFLMPNEDFTDYRLFKIDSQNDNAVIEIERQYHRQLPDEVFRSSNVSAWGHVDILSELENLVASTNLPVEVCARKFASVSLPCEDAGWQSHPYLGFVSNRFE